MQHFNFIALLVFLIVSQAFPVEAKKLGNGKVCGDRSDCISNNCLPGPNAKVAGKTPQEDFGFRDWYCTKPGANCAYPRKGGFKYGATKGKLICCNPKISYRWSQFISKENCPDAKIKGIGLGFY